MGSPDEDPDKDHVAINPAHARFTARERYPRLREVYSETASIMRKSQEANIHAAFAGNQASTNWATLNAELCQILKDNASALKDTAAVLIQVADDYQNIDEENANEFDKSRQQLDDIPPGTWHGNY